MKPLEEFLNFLFPPKCPFCGAVLDRPGVCRACEKSLPWLEEAERILPDGSRCAAPLRYEASVREGILRFKFEGASAAAEPLGELVARCAAENFSGEFDTVTWAPVSRRRLRKRGYDQAELLARAACRLWNTRPQRLLMKCRDNPAQSGMETAEQRRRNVRDVYAALPEAAGKRILLIDDVCTTGATLAECARTLRQAGAQAVLCCAVAHAAGVPQEKVHSSGEE